MRVRTLIGAEGAYACIQSLCTDIDVRLEPGRPAAQSLRETAAEWRAQAAKLQQRAGLVEEAACVLEETEQLGRRST